MRTYRQSELIRLSRLASQMHTLYRWRQACAVYTMPCVLRMGWLGFAAGLPYLLVFSTLTAWLRDVGVERSLIGFFGWIGITYSIKVLWAPVVDGVAIPSLTRRLGKRRAWLLVAQIAIAGNLFGMASTDPHTQLQYFAVLSLLVALGAATQDIVIDAYRIESAEPRHQGAMAAAYMFGYRMALLVTGAGALYLAEYYTWASTYRVMASLMALCALSSLFLPEPPHLATKLPMTVAGGPSLRHVGQFLREHVVAPFSEFFVRNGRRGVLILAVISVYKISDIVMGIMANPFYMDLGFDKVTIADVTKIFGLIMTLLGALCGGVVVTRCGIERPLLWAGIAAAATNLLFALLALSTPSSASLILVVSADNFCGGLAGAVFIAYLSSLTYSAYTATQYALFSSLMTLPAKALSGFSGVFVDHFGYPWFFLYTTALGVPSMLLVVWLLRWPSTTGRS